MSIKSNYGKNDKKGHQLQSSLYMCVRDRKVKRISSIKHWLFHWAWVFLQTILPVILNESLYAILSLRTFSSCQTESTHVLLSTLSALCFGYQLSVSPITWQDERPRGVRGDWKLVLFPFLFWRSTWFRDERRQFVIPFKILKGTKRQLLYDSR